MVLHACEQRGVEQPQVAAERIECLARSGLLAQHDADRPEIGDVPIAGQPQAEIVGTGGLGTGLQQLPGGSDADRCLRVVQAARVQARLAHHVVRPQAKRPRQFDVAVQACTANHR